MWFTQEFQINDDTKKIEINVEKPTLDFSVRYKDINLLHNNDNVVETLNIEDYLVNVVAAEMPVDYEEEALKAQATVARTYTLYQIENGHKHANADICDSSTCCQAWISKENRFEKWNGNKEEKWNKLKEAVYSTAGEIITYEGKPIDAFFHSNSGGTTEIPANVWGGSDFPYLQVVETSGEDEYNQYYSEKEYTKSELEEKMKSSYDDFQIDWSQADCIQILEYTESSRIKTIKIGNKNISGVEARKIFELKSSNFTFEVTEDKVKFKVIGYGHGVGLSQTGSNTLAKEGKNYKEIIEHFFKNIQIENIKNN
jgi:stage II sporulation protein D